MRLGLCSRGAQAPGIFCPDAARENAPAYHPFRSKDLSEARSFVAGHLAKLLCWHALIAEERTYPKSARRLHDQGGGRLKGLGRGRTLTYRFTRAESVRSQTLSLRQSYRDQNSPLDFAALKLPITAGFARKPPHCVQRILARNSLSRPVCLQTSRLRGFSTVLVSYCFLSKSNGAHLRIFASPLGERRVENSNSVFVIASLFRIVSTDLLRVPWVMASAPGQRALTTAQTHALPRDRA
jgi:hypothetical protein